MKAAVFLRRLRLVAGFAMLGSVTAGVLFGWADTSVDPRVYGASLGAVAASLKLFVI